jgi:hypothetical protein
MLFDASNRSLQVITSLQEHATDIWDCCREALAAAPPPDSLETQAADLHQPIPGSQLPLNSKTPSLTPLDPESAALVELLMVTILPHDNLCLHSMAELLTKHLDRPCMASALQLIVRLAQQQQEQLCAAAPQNHPLLLYHLLLEVQPGKSTRRAMHAADVIHVSFRRHLSARHFYVVMKMHVAEFLFIRFMAQLVIISISQCTFLIGQTSSQTISEELKKALSTFSQAARIAVKHTFLQIICSACRLLLHPVA